MGRDYRRRRANLRSAYDLLANSLVIAGGGKTGPHTKSWPVTEKSEHFENNVRSFLNGASNEAIELARQFPLLLQWRYSG